MMSAGVILGLVTLQRLAELVIARRNTRRLLAEGGYEVGAAHYPLIVAVHALWLATLWYLAPGSPISWPLIGLFLLLQLGRLWVLATLGERWTTRIIILPRAPLVTGGPFRFVRHPNYLIVAAEIALLPLAFGQWEVALFFSAANAAILAIRIRAEEKALSPSRQAR
jgi:methyltransferase